MAACSVTSVVSYSLEPHGLLPWQAPLSMGSSRQEYWSGLLCPPPEDLPHPGIKPMSFTSHALADGFFTTSTLLLLLLSRFSSVQLCATP